MIKSIHPIMIVRKNKIMKILKVFWLRKKHFIVNKLISNTSHALKLNNVKNSLWNHGERLKMQLTCYRAFPYFELRFIEGSVNCLNINYLVVSTS